MSNNNNNTTIEKLISACTGAVITSVMVTPMDVIKMRLQTQERPSFSKRTCCTWNQCSLTQSTKSYKITPVQGKGLQLANIHECALSQQRTVPRGTIDGVYKILKYEGAKALWKGLSPALIMSVPANVVYFVGYEHLKDSIPSTEYAPLMAGAVARTIAVTMISPIELFRTRLQASVGTEGFRYVLEGVKEMVVKDGPRALWRGLPPTLWRDVPFSAIYWMGYEECKKSLLRSSSINELEASFLAGAASGMFAAAVTTPFDVAKTKRQVNADKPSFDTRVGSILKETYKKEGVQGLFRGLTPRIAKVAPSCAIMISTYEMGKVLFQKL
ncbi:hypothetical protein G6F46_002957 [Rhizopus delemar]|uniref:Mitochondrial carrier n=3 Tax=Rhizopus TaxID=4842 RepID=I1CI17_RHIO9|nr:hypothetical protein RO3G_12808 [Rhizopus delemar RA 99-880]KAG1056317.1 hypothetical protein G6F43_001787 [Rhizopus delemar]KAG1145712.1 hypothetical protein G6F38_005456 [Rhizopus arrhizus]KAG1158828.1 hypothetical protein G6F37_005438 [Rhizopus arrhizus]KAG1459579.1 hypothetical protein G6F55_004675 [Rhizopus delemar]|eukprot:EIE88097.1 hypothetical protein RO3G_12808 [Rhizopus delemar RA 99-880]